MQKSHCRLDWYKAVVPKLFRAVTPQIEVAIRSYYPQYFAVIAHNIEENCGLVPHYPPKNRILPLGVIYPQVGSHWYKGYVFRKTSGSFSFGYLEIFSSWLG